MILIVGAVRHLHYGGGRLSSQRRRRSGSERSPWSSPASRGLDGAGPVQESTSSSSLGGIPNRRISALRSGRVASPLCSTARNWPRAQTSSRADPLYPEGVHHAFFRVARQVSNDVRCASPKSARTSRPRSTRTFAGERSPWATPPRCSRHRAPARGRTCDTASLELSPCLRRDSHEKRSPPSASSLTMQYAVARLPRDEHVTGKWSTTGSTRGWSVRRPK